jgi:hypothetical protein
MTLLALLVACTQLPVAPPGAAKRVVPVAQSVDTAPPTPDTGTASK